MKSRAAGSFNPTSKIFYFASILYQNEKQNSVITAAGSVSPTSYTLDDGQLVRNVLYKGKRRRH
jgi:hypothetical protein